MSRPGKYLRLIFRDPARREKLLAAYIHHRNLYSKGNGEIGSILAIVNFQSAMVTWLFLKSIIPGIPLWCLGVGFSAAIVGRTILKWAFGYYWDKYRVFDAEAEWSNRRNPTLSAIREGVEHGHL